MKIVVLDGHGANPGDLSWAPLEELGSLTVYPRTTPDEVIDHAADADILITNKVILDKRVLSALKQLKYIGVFATGFNTIDIQAAKERGIVVTNIPAYSTDSVAQMTFAHLLNITNRVDHYADESRAGRWSRNPDFCYWDTALPELAGKTIGIVGLGHIGSEVARIAGAFGMNVFAYTSKNAADLPASIRKTTLDGLFAASDILSLHCPLTADTREMINKETLAKMRPGTILINVSRGALVNEQDVAEALESGQLGAYGADVMCEEPPAKTNPLFAQPHAYITPHIAWATVEARTRLIQIAAENIRAFINGEPQNVVNP